MGGWEDGLQLGSAKDGLQVKSTTLPVWVQPFGLKWVLCF